MINIKEEKNRLREQYKKLRAEISPEERAALDKKICDSFTALASFRYANVILMYAPLEGEIDILPIAREALKRGKKVAFPLCNTEDHTMTYHYVESLDELESGSYSILEPSADAPKFNGESPSICLVPGIVFDKAGYRVGYGKGYYDRFLNSYDGACVGLVYSKFIIDSVPRGRFDVAVSVLVSENRVRMTNAKTR